MRRIIIITMLPFWFGMAAALALAAPSEKNFSIVYSQDERGAITPCG
ncbi:MAG: hypothetical protein JXR89_06105 [Deltaproteobacteria bacterium]|nr:hypothetical protein [Deltaproteobacteria bacterium]